MSLFLLFLAGWMSSVHLQPAAGILRALAPNFLREGRRVQLEVVLGAARLYLTNGAADPSVRQVNLSILCKSQSCFPIVVWDIR